MLYLQSGVGDAPVKVTGETPCDLLGAFVAGETVVTDQVSVVLRGGLGDPGPVGLTEVDVEQASSQTVAVVPLEAVHQRPGGVAEHLHAVNPDG